MIRRSISSLRPLLNTSRILTNNNPHLPLYRLPPFNFFSTQKNNGKDEGKEPQPQSPPHPEENKKQAKMSEMSMEELAEMNTEESLRQLERRAIKLEEENKKQKNKIQQIQQRLEFAAKHQADLDIKEEKLTQNIKDQQQELERITKRADKELHDSKDFAIMKLAKEVMEVADNVKRCKAYADQQIKENPDDLFLQKIIKCQIQMQAFLKTYDIQEFDPTGKPFDPNTSQSMVTIPCPPGYTVNHVATTMQTGYKIKNRLLRSARVGIFV